MLTARMTSIGIMRVGAAAWVPAPASLSLAFFRNQAIAFSD
jgi:hypothetical protein